MSKWLLLFFLTPLVEMYLLIEVGGYIGAPYTILLVVLTAIIGVGLLRVQGFATLTRGVQRLNRGEMPAREVVEGVLLAIAGALLLTPGFVTDGIGFALLTPPLRALLASRMLDRFEVRVRAGAVRPEAGTPGGGAPGSRPRGPTESGGRTIEGEFERRIRWDRVVSRRAIRLHACRPLAARRRHAPALRSDRASCSRAEHAAGASTGQSRCRR